MNDLQLQLHPAPCEHPDLLIYDFDRLYIMNDWFWDTWNYTYNDYMDYIN